MKTQTSSMNAINIMVVDDHPLLREGLVQCLQREQDFIVCCQATSTAEALRFLAAQQPDLAVVDIAMPGRDGLELIKAISRYHSQCRILALSMLDEEIYAERALCAGAHGYLMKHEPPAQIILAIRRLLEGKIVAGPAVIQRILQRTSQDPRTNPSHPLTTLTDRELEIYRLIGQGLSRGQIAGQLHLSVKTVESHRATIRRKLGLQNSTELLQHAILGQPQDRLTHRGKS